jgi:hypothetical protein
MVGFGGRTKITNYGQPIIQVEFGKGEFFEGQAVIPTLHSLAELVTSTIETLEGVYF